MIMQLGEQAGRRFFPREVGAGEGLTNREIQRRNVGRRRPFRAKREEIFFCDVKTAIFGHFFRDFSKIWVFPKIGKFQLKPKCKSPNQNPNFKHY